MFAPHDRSTSSDSSRLLAFHNKEKVSFLIQTNTSGCFPPERNSLRFFLMLTFCRKLRCNLLPYSHLNFKNNISAVDPLLNPVDFLFQFAEVNIKLLLNSAFKVICVDGYCPLRTLELLHDFLHP